MSKVSEKEIDFLKKEKMISGYQEMGILNQGLSEEGLDHDMKDLENYEKFLVESE